MRSPCVSLSVFGKDKYFKPQFRILVHISPAIVFHFQLVTKNKFSSQVQVMQTILWSLTMIRQVTKSKLMPPKHAKGLITFSLCAWWGEQIGYQILSLFSSFTLACGPQAVSTWTSASRSGPNLAQTPGSNPHVIGRWTWTTHCPPLWWHIFRCVIKVIHT